MPKPVTPLVGCDVFVANDNREVLLIRREDNGLWALPGGSQDLGETPAECAIRECQEESGFEIEILRLLGVWSSTSYEYVTYPWKENEFSHLLFEAEIVGGSARLSEETLEVSWFREESLPSLSDGHGVRISYGFSALGSFNVSPYFE